MRYPTPVLLIPKGSVETVRGALGVHHHRQAATVGRSPSQRWRPRIPTWAHTTHMRRRTCNAATRVRVTIARENSPPRRPTDKLSTKKTTTMTTENRARTLFARGILYQPVAAALAASLCVYTKLVSTRDSLSWR